MTEPVHHTIRVKHDWDLRASDHRTCEPGEGVVILVERAGVIVNGTKEAYDKGLADAQDDYTPN